MLTFLMLLAADAADREIPSPRGSMERDDGNARHEAIGYCRLMGRTLHALTRPLAVTSWLRRRGMAGRSAIVEKLAR